MDPLALVVIAATLSLAPLPLLLRLVHPKTVLRVGLLTGLGSAVLAVACFWMWQWLGQPVLAYLDAVVYGLYAVLASLVAINNRWLAGRDAKPAAGNSTGGGDER